jgi:hypothetical protein
MDCSVVRHMTIEQKVAHTKPFSDEFSIRPRLLAVVGFVGTSGKNLWM